MNDKKNSQKKTLQNQKRKPPASLFLWLLAFVILASASARATGSGDGV